jgi:hypothetical protein
MTNNNIERFAKLGTDKIETTSSASVQGILDIFQHYPDKWFTQKDFVIGLGTSNPWVNKILRKLVDQKKIFKSDQKTGNKYFYKLVSQKK